MKKRFAFIILIFIYALTVRFFKIDDIPSGFYSDEALFGYEAYSILKTGKDQFGNILPVSFKGFGDFRPGLFIYTTIPFIFLFGLTEFATRLPSVIFSTLTILIIIALSKELFGRWKIALLGGFIFAISPWSIQFARMSHETNLSTAIALSGILFLVKSIKNKIYLPISFILFSLAAYAYYTTRLFVPIFLLASLIIYRKEFFSKKKILILGAGLALILLIPLGLNLLDKERGWSRVSGVSLWGDKGIKAKLINFRQEDALTNTLFSRVFHNKLVDNTHALLDSFLIHFEPKFLLTTGDPNKLYNTPGNGLLLYIEPILILVAIVYVVSTKNSYNKLFLVWLCLGLLPDALTRFAPASPRIHLVLPLVSIMGGLGLAIIGDYLKIFKRRHIWLTGITILILSNFAYFLHSNIFHVPIRYAKEWQYGIRELVTKMNKYQNTHDRIWISTRAGLWIYYVFYLKYPPQNLQKEIVLTPKDEFGFGRVNDFGKYHFEIIPGAFDYTKNILYIGEPDEFNSKIVPDEIVYYPNREPAYYIVSTTSIKKTLEIK